MIGRKRLVYFIVIVMEMTLGGLIQVVLAESAVVQANKPEVKHREIRSEFKETELRGEIVSQPIRVPIDAAEPFLAVGVVWRIDESKGGDVRISLRGSPDGDVWSEWRRVNLDH